MRKILLFTAALLCAASMWADEMEGPWTMLTMKSGSCNRDLNPHISFNQLENNHWGTLRFWNDDDGMGYTLEGSSTKLSKNAVFYIAYRDELVPAYTRIKFRWWYVIKSKTEQHYSTTSLYARDNLSDLMDMAVDFTQDYTDQSGSNYMLDQLKNHEHDNKETTGDLSEEFEFDNRNGSTETIKSWYLMLVHVVRSGDSGKDGLHEWGSFLITQTDGPFYYYYKYVTFDANSGTGTMDVQEIQGSRNLTANAFTRDGYTFAGWATEPKGAVAYTDGAQITANANNKGPVTLYAVWTPSVAVVESIINEIGTVQYTAESKAKIDAARNAYDALSEGDRALVLNYETLTDAEAAYASMHAVAEVKTKIDAIGEVTTESEETIAQARTAYDALSAEQKAQLTATDLTTLLNAEDAYGVLTGKSTVQFKDNNDALIRSQVIALDYPEAPEIEGYTFQYWKTNAEDIENGIIRLQAVYTSTPTGIDETIFKSSNPQIFKFIKDGNLYILKDEFIYTINGQKIQ